MRNIVMNELKPCNSMDIIYDDIVTWHLNLKAVDNQNNGLLNYFIVNCKLSQTFFIVFGLPSHILGSDNTMS